MNESKNREAASFRRWLGTYVGLPLQNWHLKTIVDRYWQWPWEDLQRALRRNRGRMTRDPESRDALTKIRQECEESCGRLKPLVKRIEATDRLIDLIVYQLYKLTEQEVAIVEGGTG